MNSFRDVFVLSDIGNAFHNLEAECENERSYSAVLDLGTERRPFDDDLNERLWATDIGLSKLVMYVGVMLLSALYVNIALL